MDGCCTICSPQCIDTGDAIHVRLISAHDFHDRGVRQCVHPVLRSVKPSQRRREACSQPSLCCLQELRYRERASTIVVGTELAGTSDQAVARAAPHATPSPSNRRAQLLFRHRAIPLTQPFTFEIPPSSTFSTSAIMFAARQVTQSVFGAAQRRAFSASTSNVRAPNDRH